MPGYVPANELLKPHSLVLRRTVLVCSNEHCLRRGARIKEHLAKGQRTLAGEGMSQVTKTLLDLTQRKNFYAGDLLVSVEILRNVTDTFKRASYIPASDGVQNFFQIVSNLLDEENKEKWEDAQQIYPGSIELMQVIEDFIHIVGMGMMDFQNSYLMTGNV
ncbi:hypothetical protein lerEdw1_001347, partial [Lerista edwardsae]